MSMMLQGAANSNAVDPQKSLEEASQLNKKLTALCKNLQHENIALKASGKSVGGADATLLAEMTKKDELLAKLRAEAKQVIDKLKERHRDEVAQLKAQLAGGGKSDPMCTQGPTAHVAMLTTEVSRLTGALKEAEEKAKIAEEAKDGAEVAKQFVEADLQDARQKLTETDSQLQRVKEEARRIVQSGQTEQKSLKDRVEAAEAGKL